MEIVFFWGRVSIIALMYQAQTEQSFYHWDCLEFYDAKCQQLHFILQFI